MPQVMRRQSRFFVKNQIAGDIMYIHTYETRYGDYKDFETVKTGSVLDIIQDVSTKDSARLGYGINKLREMKIAWLIQGINVKFEKKVHTDFPIEAFTAVKSVRGVTSERGCILRQNGEVVAKSVANWFLFDTEKQKPTKITPEMQAVYEIYDFEDDFFSYVKPQIISGLDSVYKIRVSNKEIDTNKHLNNQKGADLLMDALPFDFEFNDIKILYKKPAFLGDELNVCRQEIQNGFYVQLLSESKDVCIAATFENV